MKKVHMTALGILIFLSFSMAFSIFIALVDKGSSSGSAIELRIGGLIIWLLSMGLILFLSLKVIREFGAV